MPFSGMSRCVAPVRTVSEDRIASIIRMQGMSELGTTLNVPQLLVTVNAVPSPLTFYPDGGDDTFL
jgi:hypothetical protein